MYDRPLRQLVKCNFSATPSQPYFLQWRRGFQLFPGDRPVGYLWPPLARIEWSEGGIFLQEPIEQCPGAARSTRFTSPSDKISMRVFNWL